MAVKAGHRILVLTWLALLVSPTAWAISLGAMFWLTDPVCQGMSRAPLVLTGVGCAVAALIGSAVSARELRRAPSRGIEDGDDSLVFLLRMGLWGGLVFALVIGLSLVPTAMLTPCPL